jgi:S1-C subfamily serine protease
MRFVLCSLISVLLLEYASAGEIRTWTAASGGFTVEAEFVEFRPGDLARLKTKDGRVIDVPTTQLSAADQAFLRQRAAPASATTSTAPSDAPPVVPLTVPAGASKELAAALRSAERRRRATEVLAVLAAFHDSAKTAPADRAAVAVRLAEFKPLAEQKRVKLNGRWVDEAAAAAARASADELMGQGIEFYRQKQEAGFREKFAAAAAAEPEDLRADFNMGLVYAAGREHAKAVPLFQKCLARDPEHPGALNNLALTAGAAAQWPVAANAWRRALSAAPDRRIVHNVGKFLEQSLEADLGVPKQARDILALPYTELLAGGRFKAADETVGWIYLTIDDSDLDLDIDGRKQRRKSTRTPPPTVDGPVVGGGTGFIVAPGYLLTNAHVAKEGSTFEVRTPDGKLHKAARIAASDELDLAVLKCETVTAPPLALRAEIAPRGTDVMLFGYPEMLLLGSSLKATRGSISAVPDPHAGSRYLYDAVSNAGNSGGPLCDDCGNVVAVHSLGVNTASRYAGGIPAGVALEFLRGAIPEFRPAAVSAARLGWPQVDALAAPSTLLIWVRRNDRAEPTSDLVVGRESIESPFCLFCGGDGKSKCLMRGCVSGTIRNQGESYECDRCKGSGLQGCPLCQWHGFDKKTALVKQAMVGKSIDRMRDKPFFEYPYVPPDAAEGEPIDLLPLIDPDQAYSPGLWKREGTAIVGGGAHDARFAVPYTPPREYDLEIEVRRLTQGRSENPHFNVGLVTSEGRQFNITLAKDGAMFAMSDGGWTSPIENIAFSPPVQVRFMIRAGEVAVTAGGKTAYVSAGNYGRLHRLRDFSMQGDDEHRLFIGSNKPDVTWSITSMKLIPVGADRGSPAQPGETGARVFSGSSDSK